MAEQPPRVGYILKMFPRLSETFVLHEILELQRQGVDVHVLSLYMPDEGRFHAAVAELRNPIRYLADMNPRDLFRRFRGGSQQLSVLLARAEPALEYMFELGEIDGLPVLKRALNVAFEVERLGLSHIHSHFATIAARTALVVKQLTGVPFSVTAHAKDIYRETVKPERFSRIVDEAEFLVTVCDANREYILRELAPGREDKVKRLYNGVDLARFTADTARRDDPKRPLRLLAVARLVPKKGIDILMRACALLRQRGLRFACDIVGGGEDEAGLRALCQELGLGEVVRMHGALPQDEIVPLYRAADVVVLPCVTDAEGNRDALPTTLLEGMASGAPLISTPVGGVAEIVIDGDNGLLVPEGSVEGLSAAVERLAGAPELRRQMGRRGRERATRLFDLRTNVATLRGLMEDSWRRAPLAVPEGRA